MPKIAPLPIGLIEPIYGRQPGESDLAWRAYVAYRDIGPERSFNKACEVLEKETSYGYTIAKWSHKLGWVERCHEWDKLQDQAQTEAILKHRAKLGEQMAATAESMWKFAASDLVLWHKKLQRAKSQLGDEAEPVLTPAELKNLIEAGIKLQLTLQGEATEVVDHRVAVTIDERRKRVQLMARDPETREAMETIAAKQKLLENK